MFSANSCRVGGGPHHTAIPTRGRSRFLQIGLEGQVSTMRPIRIYHPPQSWIYYKERHGWFHVTMIFCHPHTWF